jgi:hypothetical protein
MTVRGALLAVIAVAALGFTAAWARSIARKRSVGSERTLPSIVQLLIGFVTNFFDTLGIGSFAVTTAAFKTLRLVPDEDIPGTMLIGHDLRRRRIRLLWGGVDDWNWQLRTELDPAESSRDGSARRVPSDDGCRRVGGDGGWRSVHASRTILSAHSARADGRWNSRSTDRRSCGEVAAARRAPVGCRLRRALLSDHDDPLGGESTDQANCGRASRTRLIAVPLRHHHSLLIGVITAPEPGSASSSSGPS